MRGSLRGFGLVMIAATAACGTCGGPSTSEGPDAARDLPSDGGPQARAVDPGADAPGEVGARQADPDQDGVSSRRDQCPELAEDCDGFHDDDGCPDRDNDGDWIPDECDRCPDVAEVWNGLLDGDGCADVADDPAVDRPSFALVLFEPGATEPVESADEVLDEWARALARLEHVTLADVIGSAAPDEPGAGRLARARATGVVEALVARGVERGRLRVVAPPPRGAEVSRSPGVLVHVSGSRPRVRLELSRVGDMEVGRAHAQHERSRVHGWAPEAMRCPDGREVPPQAAGLVPGEPCREPLSAAEPPRELPGGLIEVVAVDSAVAACSRILPSAYPDIDGASCVLAYGVTPLLAAGPIRQAALLRVDIQDVDAFLWLALRTAAGWQYLQPLGMIVGSSLSDPQVSADRFELRQVFEGGAEELWLEARLLDRGGETLGDEDFEFGSRVELVTVCDWSDRPRCRTVERSSREEQVRRRSGRVIERQLTEARVEVTFGADGIVRIGRARGAPRRLAPLLGSHRWPDLPEAEPGRGVYRPHGPR